ncbi:hypothetical protein GJ699_30555 [Duganella sp. FT80W]|uniref:Uncharacterized protein n=1 Tax=Duganella guangzhouensis TaxID=2666084 RepID=A0A6I2L7W5_9BURK|nr:hypothetical protein [Duganella guangzhouensis]MRW94325.1 hypothetical protein [Duganella guangzhouensis]
MASSELLLNGAATGLIVTGAILEAAVEWRGYRIAFFTNDIPFEESLRIYMFDVNMAQIDAAVLGAMYSTGTFAELALHSPDTLTFRFFGGILWCMVLLSEQEFALPFLSDPSGVSRDLKFFRHFRLEDKPLREEASDVSGKPRIRSSSRAGSIPRSTPRLLTAKLKPGIK